MNQELDLSCYHSPLVVACPSVISLSHYLDPDTDIETVTLTWSQVAKMFFYEVRIEDDRNRWLKCTPQTDISIHRNYADGTAEFSGGQVTSG